MQTEPRGYTWKLAHGWQLTVSAHETETVIWLTSDAAGDTWYFSEIVIPAARLPIPFADLETLGYTPALRHDGGETPPIVLFHPPYGRGRSYALAPATGRFYELEGAA